MELIRYHLPTFVKHVLAPKNEFGIPKMTWRNCKSFGIRATPSSPYWEKFPKNVVFFLQAPLGEGGQKKTEKKSDKCQFWPYIHTYYIKTDIFLFFSQATIEIVDKLLLLGKKTEEKN